MAKGLTDLVALVGQVEGLAKDQPADVLGWARNVSALLEWLKANGWTLEDLAAIVNLGVTLFPLLQGLAPKAKPSDPR